MDKTVRLMLPLCALFLFLPACVDAPKVLQGTVVRYDAAAKALVVKDECPPHPELTIAVAGAEIGADPDVSDVVRVAYRKTGNKLEATRVMNLTRQKEAATSKKVSFDRCKPSAPQ